MNKRTLKIQLALVAFYAGLGWIHFHSSNTTIAVMNAGRDLGEDPLPAPGFPWIFIAPVVIWVVWDLGAFFLRRGD